MNMNIENNFWFIFVSFLLEVCIIIVAVLMWEVFPSLSLLFVAGAVLLAILFSKVFEKKE